MSSDKATFRVLVIGASGNFGMRLVRLLAVEPGVAIVLGGRRRAPLEALARSIGGTPEVAVLDRANIDASTLAGLRVDAVVDASGPFQAMELGVPRSAVAAGIHYVDLADARAFVAAIAGLNAAAKEARVTVLSGVSSTPALSHAAIDALCAGWRRIDTLRVIISPSNRQPRGRAVVDAILSGVGQTMTLWRDGRETMASGWGGTRRVAMPGMGRRWASWCDTPDMDLLRDSYRPHVSAEFLASLELPVMHLSLAAIGSVVRRGWLRSALPLGRALQWLATRLERFGSDWGGMVAEAKGVDETGAPAIARWWLRAKGDAGPNVPVLATAAVLRKLRNGTLTYRGAGACVGLLTLEDFAADLAALGIETGIERTVPPIALFRQALGAAFDALPPETRAIHSPAPVLVLDGAADVEGAATAAGRGLARLFGLPAAARAVPLRVVIEAEADGGELWRRVYPGSVMESRMAAADPAAPSVEERFGVVRFKLALEASAAGIDMRLAGVRLGGVTLPRFVWSHIVATERAGAGRHLFDVAISLPLIGRLVRYRGWLAIESRFRAGGPDVPRPLPRAGS